jgi:thiamine-phosphate pyrophosphorylase
MFASELRSGNSYLAVFYSPLYAIVDVEVAARAGWAARDLARAYLAGGARLLQLRAKALASGAFLDLASAIAEEARIADAVLIVNDRADLAVLSRSSGVHVGQDDLSPAQVRLVVGREAIVGFSTHSATQIAQAVAEPITYLAVGPVFGSTTKDTGYMQVGLPLVATAAAAAGPRGMPVVAIGGITLRTAPSVIAAGATSVAVITDLLDRDPESRVRQYLSALS